MTPLETGWEDAQTQWPYLPALDLRTLLTPAQTPGEVAEWDGFASDGRGIVSVPPGASQIVQDGAHEAGHCFHDMLARSTRVPVEVYLFNFWTQACAQQPADFAAAIASPHDFQPRELWAESFAAVTMGTAPRYFPLLWTPDHARAVLRFFAQIAETGLGFIHASLIPGK